MEEVIQEVDVVVIANGSPDFHRAPQLMRDDQILIDLVGIAKCHNNIQGNYEGICW